MQEYNWSQSVVKKKAILEDLHCRGSNCPEGLHCSEFSRITAAVFSLSSLLDQSAVIGITPLDPELSEFRVQLRHASFNWSNITTTDHNLHTPKKESRHTR